MKNLSKTTRRTFLQNSAKATGAGVILSSMPASASAHVAAAGEIKIAVVGCGGRGTGATAQALEADKDVQLVAMADVFADQVDKSFKGLSKKYGPSGRIKVTEETKFVGFDASISSSCA